MGANVYQYALVSTQLFPALWESQLNDCSIENLSFLKHLDLQILFSQSYVIVNDLLNLYTSQGQFYNQSLVKVESNVNFSSLHFPSFWLSSSFKQVSYIC